MASYKAMVVDGTKVVYAAKRVDDDWPTLVLRSDGSIHLGDGTFDPLNDSHATVLTPDGTGGLLVGGSPVGSGGGGGGSTQAVMPWTIQDDESLDVLTVAEQDQWSSTMQWQAPGDTTRALYTYAGRSPGAWAETLLQVGGGALSGTAYLDVYNDEVYSANSYAQFGLRQAAGQTVPLLDIRNSGYGVMLTLDASGNLVVVGNGSFKSVSLNTVYNTGSEPALGSNQRGRLFAAYDDTLGHRLGFIDENAVTHFLTDVGNLGFAKIDTSVGLYDPAQANWVGAGAIVFDWTSAGIKLYYEGTPSTFLRAPIAADSAGDIVARLAGITDSTHHSVYDNNAGLFVFKHGAVAIHSAEPGRPGLIVAGAVDQTDNIVYFTNGDGSLVLNAAGTVQITNTAGNAALDVRTNSGAVTTTIDQYGKLIQSKELLLGALSSPATPSSGYGQLYVHGDGGAEKLAFQNASGVVTELSGLTTTVTATIGPTAYLDHVDTDLAPGVYMVSATMTARDYDGETPGRNAGELTFDIQGFFTGRFAVYLDYPPGYQEYEHSISAHFPDGVWIQNHPMSATSESLPARTHCRMLVSAGAVRCVFNAVIDFDNTSTIYAGANNPTATWSIEYTKV